MSTTIVTQPYAEPISLVEAKTHLRVSHDDEDALISGLISAARKYAETFTRRQLVTATLRASNNIFPTYLCGQWEFNGCLSNQNEIVLPSPPLQFVSSITYVDENGDTQTLATSVYTVDVSEPGRVVLAYNQSWPTVRAQANSVQVNYIAGYATPFTAATTDILTAKGRTYTNGNIVRVSNSGGALPAGLSALTDYYVVQVSGSTLKLSLTSGGSAVDITDTGTGTHFIGEVPYTIKAAMLLLVAHWFEHREGVNIGNITSEVPMTVESLLYSERWGSYP